MSKRRIEDYALIGDSHTAALVGPDGSIDWLCLPEFDSDACFAALLDTPDAGRWCIGPAGAGRCTSRGYRGDTLVLETRWETEDGVLQVVDFMPPRGEAADVVRIVECSSGRVTVDWEMRVRFGYGLVRPWTRTADGDVVMVVGPDAAWLRSDVPIEQDDDALSARFELAAGERATFVLTYHASHLKKPKTADPDKSLAETVKFWESWIGSTSYEGRWSEEVRRSLILLKALTYAPTGGIVAAATTSLPESLGGSRNWDYRYCWLRDATFTLQALIGCGHVSEAKAWREWLVRAVAGDPSRLQIMYGLHGDRWLFERTVDWLGGFADSRPVRVGNGAVDQRQLDVWGEVLDGLHLGREAGLQTDEAAWDLQRGLLDWLEGHWMEPDNGLWEMRGPQRDFVHSKVMAWVGMDRAVRAVEKYGLDGPVDRWRSLREEIHQEVCSRGYDADRGTFTQFYGSQGLDASLLLLPRVGFLPYDDERIRGTVAAVEKELSQDGFVWRYDNQVDSSGGSQGKGADGLSGSEGAFLACSFWLADALHGIGERRRAEELFEKLLGCRNDVGLLSEEYDPDHGRQLGNTPQAFTLVGLVNTARHLSGATQHTGTDPRSQ